MHRKSSRNQLLLISISVLAAKLNDVCLCVSPVTVQQCSRRPTVPTETKRVRLRVRLIALSLLFPPPPPPCSSSQFLPFSIFYNLFILIFK